LGKLFGVMYVTKEMIALPSILCVYLYWLGGVSAENLAYLIGGWAVLVVYVSMLGIHCGMTYANSRSAVGVSLGCVFFLFLGIVTCMVIMVSFSGSFGGQLAPFLAFILGGGIGLYVTLGMRNPSPAIMIASFLLPFLTFFAITSFILHKELTVFLVTAVAYGFSTTAMMIPAIFEFDIAMGRTKLADED
ncbi:MAG: ABC transporter permease, partial [Planctomycetales bacterium]|nr:ABC transporter permease [Planctomycetales bacterium]